MQITRMITNNPNNYMRISIMQMARMIRAIRVSTFACPVALAHGAQFDVIRVISGLIRVSICTIRCNSIYSW